jgi:ABC-2 type transport system permease protein
MNSFWTLLKSFVKIVYRDKKGFYWTVLIPAFIYFALSVLPVGKFVQTNFEYSNFVLPGIIAMTIMQSGIYSLAYALVELKARGVIKRFLATPMTKTELIFGLLGSRILLVFIQVILLTLLGVFVFDATFAWNIVSVALLVLLGGSIFLLIGLMISSWSDSYQTAAPITSAIALPMTFLGGIFYPIETLPKALQIAAKILPITYLSDGLRQN